MNILTGVNSFKRKIATFFSKLLYFFVEKPFYKIAFKLNGDSYCSKACFINSKIEVVKAGGGNKVSLGKGTFARNCVIRINGSNNHIVIGNKVSIGPGCSFWVEGNGAKIIVGDNCTFTKNVQLNAQEDGMVIKVGMDCMFSNTIIVRTSDSHLIYELDSKQRINIPKSVEIGNHVWIAPKTDIYKGVHIGDGAIIGSHSLVTKDVKSNSLVVGMPAKEIKTQISWNREHLF